MIMWSINMSKKYFLFQFTLCYITGYEVLQTKCFNNKFWLRIIGDLKGSRFHFRFNSLWRWDTPSFSSPHCAHLNCSITSKNLNPFRIIFSIWGHDGPCVLEMTLSDAIKVKANDFDVDQWRGMLLCRPTILNIEGPSGNCFVLFVGRQTYFAALYLQVALFYLQWRPFC